MTALEDLKTRLTEDQARRDASRERRALLEADPSLIEVGEGVTMHTNAGGLRRAFTVIAVRRNGRELDVQADKVTIQGENTFADYAPRTFEPNPNGRIVTITKRNDGTYIEKGSPKVWYSTRYGIGYRSDWTDYSQ